MQSPRGFRLYAGLTLAAVLGVILWGAYVRATGAGAGCGAHWPVCNGSVVPREPSTQTLIEYTHRVTSGLSLLLVVGLFVWAYLAHPRGHTVRRAADASLVLMLIEAALGAGLVLLELVALDASVRRAVAMSLHLTNTFLLLAALGTCVWHAWVGPGRARLRSGPTVLIGMAGFMLLGVSGAVAALGDTLWQLGVSNAFVDLLVGLRVCHPLLALVEGLVLVAVGTQLWSRRPDSRRPVAWLFALVFAQLVIGALNVALFAPVWLQLVHLLVADCVWLALVVVARVALTGPAAPGDEPCRAVAAARVTVLLDGPMGSRLEEAGHDVAPPAWSARVLRSAPDAVAAIHREYAAAGCEVHRANTFRCNRRACGDDWAQLARLAVRLAREAARPGQRVAGSIGPLEDCYRPDLSWPATRDEHAQTAWALSECEVDLLLCETFPSAREAAEAVEAAVATGLETWVSFTGGPNGALLAPAQVRQAARSCVALGARAVLVNCVAAELTLPYVEALSHAGVPFGAYANAAKWDGPKVSAARYAELAGSWRKAGATIIGGCCGTTVEHLRAAAKLSRDR